MSFFNDISEKFVKNDQILSQNVTKCFGEHRTYRDYVGLFYR